MAKTIKMCDMPIAISAKVFEMLNPGKVYVKEDNSWCERVSIITDVEPKDLVYPEGWYYAKGNFRNKHLSTTGMYQEAHLFTSNDEFWSEKATYCTLD